MPDSLRNFATHPFENWEWASVACVMLALIGYNIASFRAARYFGSKKDRRKKK